MAQGLPTSPGSARGVLLRPFRPVRPMGWTGGRYTTSKPSEAMSGSAAAAVAKVPCWPAVPVERGKNSYQAPAKARGRQASTRSVGPRVARWRSGARAASSTRAGDSAASTAAGPPARSRSA